MGCKLYRDPSLAKASVDEVWKKHMWRKLTLPLLFVVGACASPPKSTEAEFTVKKSFSELAALYERQIRKCWRKEATAFEDGIAVSARPSDSKGAIFTATRQGLAGDAFTGRTFKYAPFVHVELVPLSNSATLVKVRESEHCLLFESCIDLGAGAQLQDWEQGNLACRNASSGTR